MEKTTTPQEGLEERGPGAGDKEALEQFIGAALLEEKETQYQLSVIYELWWGDFEKALDWLTKAAAQAHTEALFCLGKCYAEGRGVPQDDEAASEYYAKAINRGHLGAQFELGLMYAEGRGVPQDSKLALRRLKKAADGGHLEAQFLLGKMYCEGQGVTLNKPWGCKLLQQAGKAGHEEAMRLYKQFQKEVGPKRKAKAAKGDKAPVSPPPSS